MGRICATLNPEMSIREKIHQDKIRRIASQGMVLMENDGTLPLRPSLKKLALYGTGARNTVKGGTGSGEVNSREIINIEQGLERAGYTVTTKPWLDSYDHTVKEKYEEWGQCAATEIINGISPLIYLMERSFKIPQPQEITEKDVQVSDTDTAIYVVSRSSGEGADRYDCPGDYRLSMEEEKNLQFLAENYKHLIVVLNVGGIIDTKFLRYTKGISAVLLMSQAGNTGGDAVADLLSGKENPSGKLTDTWAENYEDYPFSSEFSHNNGNVDDAYYREGIYVGYRYFDTFNMIPAYCFGYGLSYTKFVIETENFAADANQVRIKVSVKNVGNYAGKEVIQIYYSAPDGIVEKPYQELATFGKTKLLQPGEIQSLELEYSTSMMASYSESMASWVLEKGIYFVRVGNSSRNTRIAGALHLDEITVTCKVENLFPLEEPLEELSKGSGKPYFYPEEYAQKQNAIRKVIFVENAKIKCEKIVYREKQLTISKKENGRMLTLRDVKDKQATLWEVVGQMSEEEMASICVGRIKEGFSVIGNASTTVPGAAGETTDSMVESRGIRSLVLADGPAGLRLTKSFQVGEDGRITGDGGFDWPQIIRDAISKVEGKCEEGKNKEAVQTYYQYCTAIPVAALLAQSWDEEVLRECGEVIGQEMLEFGVDLWLAPGMNIHRNPLCGRNFEYYSEDPVLSGLCAAAITKGVQKYPNIGTTIKHLVTNNQEDNRSFENNHVTERALREIYLKGFEICIKEAKPMAIMTSYNLLNGVHTANRYDLLNLVVRDEWGFQGVIMTDWGTTGSMSLFNSMPKYPSSSAAICIKAGNDLIMPGTKEDIEEILKSVKGKQGESVNLLTLGELQFCTYNILELILRMTC